MSTKYIKTPYGPQDLIRLKHDLLLVYYARGSILVYLHGETV